MDERVLEAKPSDLWEHVSHKAGVTRVEFDDYFGDREKAYAIVVRKVWRLAPVTLSSMRKAKIRPPQSYQYLDGPTAARLSIGAVSRKNH